MKNSLKLHTENFVSASNRTPQYLTFHRTFKREFSKALTELGCENILVHKPNHFDFSGFFTFKGKVWYFSLSDLRWDKDRLLIRSAKHYKDYSGGANNFITIDQNLINNILKFVSDGQA